MTDTHSPAARHLWLPIALGAFILAALFIDPVREMTLEDDWAYALTVRQLLETGRYALNDWAAANMPFQAYWGALFTLPAGFSLSALRISTAVLSFIGIISFYNLAREHRLDRAEAGLLALVYLSSPLVLRFSFNFMTDMPFLSCMTAALWLHTRAIRRWSYPLMIGASLVTTAAILTRQFGVAVIGGLFLLAITHAEYRRRFLFFISGMIIPSIAALWQFFAGVADPTWAQSYSKISIANYFGDIPGLLASFFWRPTVILQYLALFILPLLPVLALAVILKRKEADGDGSSALRAPSIGIIAIVSTIAIAGLLCGHYLLDIPLLMPQLPWNFDILNRLGTPIRLVITVITTVGAILMGSVMLRGRERNENVDERAPMQFLGWTTLLLLLLTLIFFKIGDEYIIVFLPYALIVVGRYLRGRLTRHAMLVAAGSFLLLIVGSLWVREHLSIEEALWRGGETLRTTGIPVSRIDAGWNWASYNGAFAEYLDTIDARPSESSDGYFQWYNARRRQAEYIVTPGKVHGTLIATVPYTTIGLKRREMYVKRK